MKKFLIASLAILVLVPESQACCSRLGLSLFFAARQRSVIVEKQVIRQRVRTPRCATLALQPRIIQQQAPIVPQRRIELRSQIIQQPQIIQQQAQIIQQPPLIIPQPPIVIPQQPLVIHRPAILVQQQFSQEALFSQLLQQQLLSQQFLSSSFSSPLFIEPCLSLRTRLFFRSRGFGVGGFSSFGFGFGP